MQETTHARVEDILDRMTAAEKVGQMVMALKAPGRPGLSDVDHLVREYHVGSVISYWHSHLTPAEVAASNNDLQRVALETRLGIPLLIGADLEQGVATQVPGTTDLPQQMGLGAIGDPAAAEIAASITGVEARAIGLHWNFAPTADVNTNHGNPVIGVRAFSDDTGLVCEMTAAQVRGYRRAAVLPCAKHFPGHGAASLDSHRALPVINLDWETFERIHLPPFLRAIEEGTDTIMTAHIILSAVDAARPATLSRSVLTGLLREQLGYQGIVVTDLMSMQAIAGGWNVEEAAVLAARAGVDVIMAATDTQSAIRTVRTLRRAVEEGSITEECLDASVRRVLAAKERLCLFEDPYTSMADVPSRVATAEHLDIAHRLAQRSITLVKNEGILPFDRAGGGRTLVAGVTNQSVSTGKRVTHVPRIAEMVRQMAAGEVVAWAAAGEDPTVEEIAEAARLAVQADRVIALTYSRDAVPEGQVSLVRALQAAGRPLAVISTGKPYDLASFPEVPAFLASYALSFVPMSLISPRTLEAAVAVLFGQEPGGSLPVEVSGAYPRGTRVVYARSEPAEKPPDRSLA